MTREKKIFALLEKAKTLPHAAGCYLMRQEDKIIYIGKAKDLNKRVQSYFKLPIRDHKTSILVSHITDFDFILTQDEVEALIVENRLIKQYHPRYNIRLRDDKSYPFIVVDYQEPFPRPRLERNVRRSQCADYLVLGPFVHGSNIRDVLRILIKVFKLRDCSLAEMKRRKEACLLYQMQQCSAPCTKQIEESEYSRQLERALAFFKGQESAVLEYVESLMEQAASEEQFEQAAIFRDALSVLKEFSTFYQEYQQSLIDNFSSVDIVGFYIGPQEIDCSIQLIRHGKLLANQHYNFLHSDLESHAAQLLSFLIQYYQNFPAELPANLLVDLPRNELQQLQQIFTSANMHTKVRINNRKFKRLLELVAKDAQEQQRVRLQNEQSPFVGLRQLQQLLKLSEMPRRLECYDIAIWQGSSPTAAQIVFEDGKAIRSAYRHYHLQLRDEGNNDFAMMSEVLVRRLKYGALPDLFIVDGGVGQVNVFYQLLVEHKVDIPVVGIAKSKLIDRSKGEYSEERLILPGRKNPILLKKYPALFRIIVQMRDEAHRFSRRLHHHQEQQRVLGSALDRVPNIGPRIKRKILRNLERSLEEVVQGELYEIMDELQVSLRVAKSLKEFFC